MLTKSLAKMTDADLDAQRSYWSAEIASRSRWGEDIEHARDARDAVEREQRRRRIMAARAGNLHIRPIVVDDPGVRPALHSAPVITGAGKARAERRPTRFGLTAALGALLVFLAVSAALAGQRLVELEDRFAAMEQV
nr:hypothetical protein REQ54_01067 [Rhizobium sp. Q54]